jgi:phasin family protein
MTTKKTANTAKTVEDTVTETVEAAVTMTKEKVEEMQDQYTKAYEDFAVLGQASVDVMVKATSIFTKGAEDITKAYFAFAKITADSGVEATKAVLGAKTIKDAVEVQSDYAKQSFDKFVAEGAKISDMSVKVANETFEPIKEQIQVNVEKAMKAA